jgi:hypothetical protein
MGTGAGLVWKEKGKKKGKRKRRNGRCDKTSGREGKG